MSESELLRKIESNICEQIRETLRGEHSTRENCLTTSAGSIISFSLVIYIARKTADLYLMKYQDEDPGIPFEWWFPLQEFDLYTYDGGFVELDDHEELELRSIIDCKWRVTLSSPDGELTGYSHCPDEEARDEVAD